jgi:integrase
MAGPYVQRKLPMTTLKNGGLQMQVDGWGAPQSAAAAVRYIRPVLKWAAQRNAAPNELTKIVPPTTVRRRKRTLTRDELAAVLPALRASSRPYAPALRFMLLTLTRRQETALARWRDVDMEARTWTTQETKKASRTPCPCHSKR